eukprot:TRINITY_DN10980_c0_g1_i1.p1 TRINITY_DN10980_c0_g1~~TRINITY_DN10980_c0_g1_i1.p1  ORF type:complete len:404 (+),score=123.54 TRINITY_DN10980_c0_g1_i1:91-1302(+)
MDSASAAEGTQAATPVALVRSPKLKSAVSALFDTKPEASDESYLIAVDNLKLLYKHFEPKNGKPKASVILIHGFGEHHGRFLHVVQSFLDNQCIVHTIDLRGHGLSGGSRADGKFENFMMDFNLLHSKVDPNLPCFFYGHSMGGMMVLHYALSVPQDLRGRIDGVISSSPWLKLIPKLQPQWYKKLALLLAGNLFDDFLISSNVDPCSLSARDKVAHEAINDRLVLPFLTIRFVKQLVFRSDYVLRHADKFQIPLLMIHGAKDRLTSCRASEEFVKRMSFPEKKARIFSESYHEVHNDADAIEYLREINHWISERVNKIRREDDLGNDKSAFLSQEMTGMIQDPRKMNILMNELDAPMWNRRKLFTYMYLILIVVFKARFNFSVWKSLLWPLYFPSLFVGQRK